MLGSDVNLVRIHTNSLVGGLHGHTCEYLMIPYLLSQEVTKGP